MESSERKYRNFKKIEDQKPTLSATSNILRRRHLAEIEMLKIILNPQQPLNSPKNDEKAC